MRAMIVGHVMTAPGKVRAADGGRGEGFSGMGVEGV